MDSIVAEVTEEAASVNLNPIPSSVNPTKAFPEVKISVNDIMKAGTEGKYVAKSMIFFLNPVTI